LHTTLNIQTHPQRMVVAHTRQPLLFHRLFHSLTIIKKLKQFQPLGKEQPSN